MPTWTYREAITRALADSLRADPRVILFGEDVAQAGGVFKTTPGLLDEFGPARVRDTPISEQAFIGAALGAAITGLRPVTELMFADFVGVAFDQIVNQIAKYRYMSGGQFTVPLVIRAAQGCAGGFGTQHSQCVEAWLLNAPGLKIVSPATPADAYGLLRTAITDNNPVVFLEHKGLYNLTEEIPDTLSPLPFGQALVRRSGTDVTLVATQLMVHRCLEAAEQLAADGISAEVLDLRTLAPLDEDAILASLARTHRLVIVEENPAASGWGANVAALAADRGLDELDAHIKRVTMGTALVPYSPPLEDASIPNVGRIVATVRELIRPFA